MSLLITLSKHLLPNKIQLKRVQDKWNDQHLRIIEMNDDINNIYKTHPYVCQPTHVLIITHLNIHVILYYSTKIWSKTLNKQHYLTTVLNHPSC